MRFESKEEFAEYMRRNGLTPPDEFIRLGMIVAAKRHADATATRNQAADEDGGE
ncbi:hypothetical protein [Bifidobacterium sp. SO1]|uniref:hypothetical protein n=1 Tax=Bifidobacterium sp. SO1 TaxID=2809029 RepID=UPI001BDCCC7F|nr:hypothetical protein [Bifidobacterium sp. SO1]MBT1162893.1 hypothetical protein [Bifidobacterium sp. SO1]